MYIYYIIYMYAAYAFSEAARVPNTSRSSHACLILMPPKKMHGLDTWHVHSWLYMTWWCTFYSWVQHSKNSNDRLFGHTDFARVPFLTYIFYRQLLLEIPFFGVNKRALKNSCSYGWFIRYARTFDIFNPHNLKQKHNITHVNFTQNIHPNKIRV